MPSAAHAIIVRNVSRANKLAIHNFTIWLLFIIRLGLLLFE
jgi:hypothetical protein